MARTTFEGKAASETTIKTFNFISLLAAAETISTAVVTASVYSGTDASPSSLVSGSATISGQTVTQKITAGTLGVVYTLLCTITTSLGQTRVMSAFLAVVPNTQ